MKKAFLAFIAIATFGVSTMSAAGAPAVYDIDPFWAVDWDSNGQYLHNEQLHEYQRTNHDFNNMMQSQILVWGYPTASNPYPQVKIGTSIGHYVGKQAIDSNGVIVGYLMGFDHYGVTQGYLHSKYYNGVYDNTAYIK